MTATLTPARFRALEELVRSGGLARISNRTDTGCILWQSADWLCEHGLARQGILSRQGIVLEITDTGLEAWMEWMDR